MGKIELKRCPFCGMQAEIYKKYGSYGPFIFCECTTCGARAKTFKIDEQDEEWELIQVKRAIEAWNMRTN